MPLQLSTPKHHDIVESVRRFATIEDTLRLPTFAGNIEKLMFEVALSVQTIYTAIDGAAQEMRDSAETAGTKVYCSDGCAHCCYEPIVGTFAESILIYLFLDKNEQARENFKSKYKDWRNTWRKRDIEPNIELLHRSSGLEMLSKCIEVDSIYGRVPCPFLDESSCSIYEARPTVCRRTLSINEPELCAQNMRMMFMNEKLFNLVGDKSRKIFVECSYRLDMPAFIIHLAPFLTQEIMNNPRRCLREYARLCQNMQKEHPLA